MTDRTLSCFAVTPPGFETVCASELQRLGIESVPEHGGVAFAGGLRELYLANLWLRSASRVLVRLGDFQARDFPALYRKLLQLPWGRFIKRERRCTFRVSCQRSRLSHSGRVAETAQQALTQALGSVAEGDSDEQQILLRLVDDQCQVSVDSSGELLHRRGYRGAKGAAPLRENLAAGCLLALGYDGTQPLVDLMAGSGTFAIEGALIAMGRAPGRDRNFAFQQWPKYRAGLWRELRQQAVAQELTQLPAAIFAVDSNPQAVAAARQNLLAAGLQNCVQLDCRPFQELQPAGAAGLVIGNPPYGERLGRNASLQALYADLGRCLGRTFAGWQGALVCPAGELMQGMGIPMRPRLEFSNGGISVSLLQKR